MQQTIGILATGGTIAGVSTVNSSSYTAGVLDVNTLLKAIPQLSHVANIETQQVYAIDSSQATPAHWMQLAKAAQAMLERHDIHGLVITHGTDTLEETAFYLHLVLKTTKPVVIVGAMRPADALSADGAQNILDAVRLACDPRSHHQGVLVTLNQAVFSARYVIKSHTQQVASFMAAECGPVAWIYHDQIHWHAHVLGMHTVASPFSLKTTLPKVEILLCYPGMSIELFDVLTELGVQGLVIAGLGNGCLPSAVNERVIKWRQQGVSIVISSRTYHGAVTSDVNQQDVIFGNSLSVYKARVLLMLLLGSQEGVEIEQSLWNQF